MIHLYTRRVPSGQAVSIMLEEIGLPYTAYPVIRGEPENRNSASLAIGPSGKIPFLTDDEGPNGSSVALNEPIAILIYLAEKTRSRLWPSDPADRYSTLQWLMTQNAGLGPAVGYANEFIYKTEKHHPFAVGFMLSDIKRHYEHIDRRLGESSFLGGAEYSVADIATYPFLKRHERFKMDIDEYPKIRVWLDRIAARPGVERGMAIPRD